MEENFECQGHSGGGDDALSQPCAMNDGMISTQPQAAAVDSAATASASSSKPGKCKSRNQAKRKTMAPRSSVWLHFEKITNEKGEHKAKCKYCERLLASHPKDNGTSSLRSHYNSCLARIALESKQSELVFTAGNEEWDKGLGCWKFDQESIRKGLSFMIIVDELPFKFVENEGFKHLMAVACPRFHVPSRHTIARDCFEQYSIERKKLKQYFKNTNQRVCLTTDTWTSLQKVNYMCLTAHFIDENWKLHKKILNFCTITGHRGEIIGRAVENCLLDWGIDRVFTITVDNASSNDVAIEFLKKKISNWGTSVVGCKYLHMRCIAHIINLVVVDGLKEMHDSVARVRAAVKFVKQSPARYANFKKCIEMEKIESKALLCLDVSTRWNSTYLMFNAAQKFERAFKTYATDDPHFEHELNELTGGILTSDDWENVRRLVTFLENFYDLTCRISGSLYVTSNTFFHEISEVDGLLYEWGTSDDLEFAFMARKMREKYEKYWGNVEKMNMLIYVAVILDPRHKLKYVEFALNEMYQSKKDLGIKLAQKAKDALNELFSWYEKTLQPQNCGQSSGINQASVVLQSETQKRKGQILKERKKKFMSLIGSDEGKSDLIKYLNEECESDEDDLDVLQWWKLNSGRFPILSQMARDVLAVPISIVASESAFSTGGRVLDAFRSSLTPKMVQALICCQDWLRRSMHPVGVEEDLEEIEKLEEDLSKVALANSIIDI